MHSYSIFVCKEKYGMLLKRVFDDTILEFMGKMSEMTEAREDDIEVLFKALPLDWETMSPPPAPLIPAIGEPHPSSAHATLQD